MNRARYYKCRLPPITATDKPSAPRFEKDHINILAVEIQWLLFEYGVGVLATDQHGRAQYCTRTGYIPGDAINIMIYNRCLGCDQMIRNLIDDLTHASNRCAFLFRLHRHLNPKPASGGSGKKGVVQLDLLPDPDSPQ